ALGDALFQVVPEQHSLLSSDQARLQQRRGGAKVTESLGTRSARAPASCQVSDFQPPKVSDLQPPATAGDLAAPGGSATYSGWPVGGLTPAWRRRIRPPRVRCPRALQGPQQACCVATSRRLRAGCVGG